MATTDQVPDGLADRLAWLFKHVTKSGGEEFTLQEVEDGTDRLGHRVTVSAIWKIRRGVTKNPSYLVLQTLAKFFGISADFFYNQELTSDELDRMKVAAALRDAGVEEIALRSSRLDAAGREAILNMLRYMVDNQDDDHEDTGST